MLSLTTPKYHNGTLSVHAANFINDMAVQHRIELQNKFERMVCMRRRQLQAMKLSASHAAPTALLARRYWYWPYCLNCLSTEACHGVCWHRHQERTAVDGVLKCSQQAVLHELGNGVRLGVESVPCHVADESIGHRSTLAFTTN